MAELPTHPTDILNVRHGLRRLLQNPKYRAHEGGIPRSELTEEREPRVHEIIRQLATALVEDPAMLLVDHYGPEEIRKDWVSLTKKEMLEGGEIIALDSRSRPGHKILDHHMPHFFHVANHKGISVASLMTQEALEKALHANLAMHTTPYKSEIRRMLVMTGGLSNVTKYRAATAKGITQYFGATRVLDPCVGWGGRMLGVLATGAHYVGCEPDPNTADGLRRILANPALPTSLPDRTRILERPVEECWDELGGPFDMVLTSPPYFNLELYTGGPQSVSRYPTWAQWVAEWLKPVILGCLGCLREGGVSCWSVKNIRTDRLYPLASEVSRIHKEAGWDLVKTVTLRGSARPGGGRVKDGKETRESEEETYCYRRR